VGVRWESIESEDLQKIEELPCESSQSAVDPPPISRGRNEP
jgi:hypothetical protein